MAWEETWRLLMFQSTVNVPHHFTSKRQATSMVEPFCKSVNEQSVNFDVRQHGIHTVNHQRKVVVRHFREALSRETKSFVVNTSRFLAHD